MTLPDYTRNAQLGLFLFLLVPAWVFAKDSCIDCHKTLEEGRLAARAYTISQDVHYERGISCAGCHGGDPTKGFEEGDPGLAMDPAKGYVGVPKPQDIPRVCGRCHSDVEFMKKHNPKLRVDQVQLYWTSIHGKRLRQGDTRVATCINCHGVHGIFSISDTRSPVFPTNVPKTCAKCHADKQYMKFYDIPTNQYDLFARSIHGELLLKKGNKSAPACNDCHGSHGATPPGLSDIAGACGECHAANRDLFAQSPHKIAFEKRKLPECETCHGNHLVKSPTDEWLGTGEKSICSRCHTPDSKGGKTASQIYRQIDSLKIAIAAAQKIVKRAERAGVNVQVETFNLGSASDALVRARNQLHALNTEAFSALINEGIARANIVKTSGLERMKDLQTRRYGLAGTAIIVLGLAFLLFLKIKQFDRRSQ